MPLVKPFTIWYAISDSTVLERVQVVGTSYYAAWGRYVLYRPIDWPVISAQQPLCCHEETFLLHYTPQDEPCENTPTESFSSKTFSPPPPSWFSGLRRLWRRVLRPNNNS